MFGREYPSTNEKEDEWHAIDRTSRMVEIYTFPCDDTSVCADPSPKRVIILLKRVREESEETINREYLIGASILSLLQRLVLLRNHISER